MDDTSIRPGWTFRLNGEVATWLLATALIAGASLYPSPRGDLLLELARGMGALVPVVAVASLLAGALAVGTWSERIIDAVGGGGMRAVALASIAGTITPVCGLGVLPLIASLLRRGVPLAPVMAFWVSSPIMGPSMVVVTLGILGTTFALAKAVAAFGVGLLAGTAIRLVPGLNRPGDAVMRGGRAVPDCSSGSNRFWAEAWHSTRLVLRWLFLALVLEILLQRLIPDEWIGALFGSGNAASVPLAAVVGAPLYVDGYAALPLVRGLMEMGMGFGAALAFMISGAAVSLYAVVAVAAIVQTRVFILYVALAVLGAIIFGYAADLWM